MQPNVLLLDEPLSNLDAKLRERLRVELKQTQQRLGTTSVYVTHDQAEALALADRIVLMKKGVIEQISTPLELYTNPKTRFAAEFIGTNNLFAGRFSGTATGQIDIDELSVSLNTAYKGQPGDVSVCIRAEDGVINPPETWPGTTIDATVEVVSLLGSQVQYSLRINDRLVEVTAAFAGGLLERGERVRLGILPEHVRCFPEGATKA
jgi:iron(III) transport system ATP-binding protein